MTFGVSLRLTLSYYIINAKNKNLLLLAASYPLSRNCISKSSSLEDSITIKFFAKESSKKSFYELEN